jgi:hypothetical protein
MNDGPVDPAHGLHADIGQIVLHVHDVTLCELVNLLEPKLKLLADDLTWWAAAVAAARAREQR